MARLLPEWLKPRKKVAEPPGRPIISVVLGTYNRARFLERALASVRNNDIRVPYEIIVVDGGSSDGTLEWLIGQPDVITIVQHNRRDHEGRAVLLRRSWGYFMNLGFKIAEGKYILMLSDDSLLLRGAVNRGVDLFEKLEAEGRRVGAMAFYFRNWPEEKEYYVQLTLGGKLFVNHGLFRRAAIGDVGWVDADRYAFYKADGDLCLKLWNAGWEVVDCPGAYVEHYVHTNRAVRETNRGLLDRDRQAYLERWRGIYYDPKAPQGRSRVNVRYDDPDRTAEAFLRAGER